MEAAKKQIGLLDEFCRQINRDPKTLKRSFAGYEREAMHNISAMKHYESIETIQDLVKWCLDLGFAEIMIPYPFIEKDVPAFEQIAREVIPELRKSYS